MDRDTKFDLDDLVVCIPDGVCGEAGEPLHQDIHKLINSLAGIGYLPMDFGEQMMNGATELWFVKDSNLQFCRDMAEHFIRKNGDV